MIVNFQDLHELNISLHKSLHINIVNDLVESLAVQLINDEEYFDIDFESDLLDSFLESSKGNVDSEFTIGSTSLIHLRIKIKSLCDFVLFKADETKVGLGSIGDLDEVSNIENEIKSITLYLLENEFDLTLNKNIRGLIIEKL